MKITPKQYAVALLEALEQKNSAERKKILRSFLALIRKNNSWSQLNTILSQFEKQYFIKMGMKKIYIESPEPLLEGLHKNIENIVGKNIFISSKTNSRLLAGIKILINDELLIDASAKAQLNRLFSK